MTRAQELESLFDTDAGGSPFSTSAPALTWHPQVEVMRQGTRWHGAGLATTADQHAAIDAAERAIYPSGWSVTARQVWQAEAEDTAFVEWRAEAETWRGEHAANGGLSVYEWEDGAVRRVRHFTNTAYLEALEDGWIELLGDDHLMRIPAYHSLELASQGWKPYPPAKGSKLMTTPPREFDDGQLSIPDRVARFYEPARLLRDAGADRWQFAPGGYMEFQGTRWWYAGRNHEAEMAVIGDLHHQIFQGTIAFSHLAVWHLEALPNCAMHEWVSRGTLWTGRKFANHGLTFTEFDEDARLLAHREYLNVAYLEDVMKGWDKLLDAERLVRLACAPTMEARSTEWSPIPLD
jgi:ketosteroid isomerase-like protein